MEGWDGVTDSRDAVAVWDGSMEHQILAAAAALFAERGYATTSTRELAARVGVRSASIYYHFPSKGAILRRICADSLARITSAASSVAEPEPSVASFSRMIEAHLLAALKDRDMHATMLIELPRLPEGERNEVRGARDRHEELLRTEVERMQAAGLFRADMDPRLLTLALLNLLNWTIFWFREGGSLDERTLATAFAQLFLEGALADGAGRAAAASGPVAGGPEAPRSRTFPDHNESVASDRRCVSTPGIEEN
jgi:AcrR family transcriptional regulator